MTGISGVQKVKILSTVNVSLKGMKFVKGLQIFLLQFKTRNKNIIEVFL
jgi:hypothetical protein